MKQIIDFIDNEDFAKANSDKDFTLEEKVSLVAHNYSVSLEEKYEYLLSLDYSGNNTLKKQVEEWIDLQKYKVDYIKKLNDKDIAFVINYPDSPSLSRVFTEFNKIHIDEYAINNGVNIDRINCAKDLGQIGRISFTKENEISSCSLIDDSNSKLAIKSPLYDIKVNLNNPYKPFDIIKVPLRFGYLIVANPSSLTKEVLENHNEGTLRKGWLNTNIPYYSFSNGWILDPGTDVGVFNDTFLPLSMISKVNEEDITVYQHDYVEELKKQIKQKMSYV